MTKLDWHSAPLTDTTCIDEAYKNTQNVRRYFKARCGEQFKFDRSFMAWMKANVGKTMGEAVVEWKRREEQRKSI